MAIEIGKYNINNIVNINIKSFQLAILVESLTKSLNKVMQIKIIKTIKDIENMKTLANILI